MKCDVEKESADQSAGQNEGHPSVLESERFFLNDRNGRVDHSLVLTYSVNIGRVFLFDIENPRARSCFFSLSLLSRV